MLGAKEVPGTGAMRDDVEMDDVAAGSAAYVGGPMEQRAALCVAALSAGVDAYPLDPALN